MTLARPQQTNSAAQTRAFGTPARKRHGSALLGKATLAVVALLVAASPASAIVITGGPTTSPGNGWSCTAPVAGTEKEGAGSNFSCSGTGSAFSNLYIGINRLTGLSFGNTMDSSGGSEASGNERFLWSANPSGTSIRYTGQSAMVGHGAVDIRVTLTFSGAGTLVTDATTQALTGAQIRGTGGVNTAPGVNTLWRIGAGVSSMTVTVLLEASDAGSGAWQPANTYFGTTSTHRQGDGVSEVTRSHVDLAFYTSTCGDGTLDNVSGTDGSAEACDLGGANGAATSCCTSTCGFRTAGQVCRTVADVCDTQETCTGSSGTCPADGFLNSSNECRPSAGVCDPAENCTGSGAACPGNGFSSSATVCRASAGVCDPAENCTGSTAPCPADDLTSSATVCRPSAGVCDIAENCTGSDVDCPADSFESSATVCRGTAGICDVAENCTGSAADCPTDGFEPSTLECRASADVCDVAESCTGAGTDCPADGFQPSTVECRGSAGPCDIAENCSGTGTACPADAFQPTTEVCRAVAGVCDVAENCDGATAACPTDAFEPATVECRPDAGQCDVADNCMGSQADCPADSFEPNGTSCDDAAVCTIDDVCVVGACVGDSQTCGDGVIQGSCGEECDDSNTDPNDGCSPTCLIEIGLACPATPFTGCKPPFVPGKSQLKLTNKSPNTKDALKWSWARGTRTTLAELGLPLTATNYQFCLYDQTGLRIEMTTPAGGTCAGKPCWKPTGLSGFKYSDKELTPDGTQKLSLKQGAVEKAKIQLSGRGDNLDMPADLNSLQQPIIVQIHNSDGVCWETIFSGPPTRQTADKFQDKAD